MIKTEAKAFRTLADNVQSRVYGVVDDLKIRKERGDASVVDTYEFGFLSAMHLMNEVYHLDIDFGDEEA